MYQVKVAIITRTKNRTLMLKRAIQSVINQVFQDWNLIIINDGGDRNEIDLLLNDYKDYSSKINLVNNEHSLGMEAASNLGIKSSSSKYIAIHDDDDSWNPNFLEKCVTFLDSTPNSELFKNCLGAITYTEKIIETIQENRINTVKRELLNNCLETISLYKISQKNLFPPISFVYSRKVLEEIGFYREDLPVLGDWEFNIRFMMKYDIHIVKETLAYYHYRSQSSNVDYDNSVTFKNNLHLLYADHLRNQLLREDLIQNKLGIGYLMNSTHELDLLNDKLNYIERRLSINERFTSFKDRLGKSMRNLLKIKDSF